jgi:hypothetical protein
LLLLLALCNSCTSSSARRKALTGTGDRLVLAAVASGTMLPPVLLLLALSQSLPQLFLQVCKA